MLADDDETLMRLFSSVMPKRSFIVSLFTDSGGSASKLQPVSLSCSSFTGFTSNCCFRLVLVLFYSWCIETKINSKEFLYTKLWFFKFEIVQTFN